MMKIIMYGSRICSDCVWAEKKLLERSDIALEYRQITQDVTTMKAFLSYRDHDVMFEPIIGAGQIGIPFFILEDGSKTFDVKEILSK